MWVGSGCGNSPEYDGAPRGDRRTPAPPGRTATSHGRYAFDPADDRRLVAFSDNVFVGTVSEKVGNRGLPTSRPDGEVPKCPEALGASGSATTTFVSPPVQGDPVAAAARSS